MIVMTHVPADKHSRMAEVLAGFTSIPVREIAKVTPLEPGVVYTLKSASSARMERAFG